MYLKTSPLHHWLSEYIRYVRQHAGVCKEEGTGSCGVPLVVCAPDVKDTGRTVGGWGSAAAAASTAAIAAACAGTSCPLVQRREGPGSGRRQCFRAVTTDHGLALGAPGIKEPPQEPPPSLVNVLQHEPPVELPHGDEAAPLPEAAHEHAPVDAGHRGKERPHPNTTTSRCPCLCRRRRFAGATSVLLLLLLLLLPLPASSRCIGAHEAHTAPLEHLPAERGHVAPIASSTTAAAVAADLC